MVKTIYLFWNGAVAVCDERGEQMPELQGSYRDVVERLSAHDLSSAEINVADSIIPGCRATPEQFLGLSVGEDGLPFMGA